MKKKNWVCLGSFLLCGLLLAGCSSMDTSKLEEKVDKISKSVDNLHERIDELSENGVDISNTATSSTKEKKSAVTSESTEQSSDETKKVSELKNSIIDYTIKNEKIKFTVTKVDFIQNISSHLDKDGLVIVYYTMENTGSENIETNIEALNYLYVTEEDKNTETHLDWANELYRYKEYKELYNKSTSAVKPGGKVESAISFYILDNSMDINIKVSTDPEFKMTGENAEAAELFTAKTVSKSFKENKDIKPE
ncbi:DUF5067 domain-containing protein [Enterococcus sp. BWB1-3]|uniref:DUF5067 domain-containing protein n=1 Tax=unclassified Enterococcus TaxID=2608891 RepID=UPI0019212396|nr:MULTISPECIES: DUF5067 domain-containing protein [unclassified Enterococcus]MBL1229789.1 DUF5067 domain-containing protein [Enterococcus sp. BWB1-3]MCB5953024.1 DUF5067 domain-containing protein [Enterococcus sp. BWT-B8]MCB5955413.1 DUF5067 domain-containing protein [Enterococcus sp. CWB-B31]